LLGGGTYSSSPLSIGDDCILCAIACGIALLALGVDTTSTGIADAGVGRVGTAAGASSSGDGVGADDAS
jgi:hypothetical protein